MNAIELNAEISDLRARETQLQEQAARCAGALSRALAAEPARYDQNAVNRARSAKARTDQELADLAERIAALAAQLPSPDAVEHAETEAQLLINEARAANVRSAEAWSQFIASLDATFVSACALATVRASATDLAIRLSALARQYAIAVPRQEEPRPSVNDLRFAQLVATFLQEVSVGQRNDDLMRALNAMRAERQVQSEGAA